MEFGEPDIVSIDSSGLVTGIAVGHATVTATSGGITGSLQISVLHIGH